MGYQAVVSGCSVCLRGSERKESHLGILIIFCYRSSPRQLNIYLYQKQPSVGAFGRI